MECDCIGSWSLPFHLFYLVLFFKIGVMQPISQQSKQITDKARSLKSNCSLLFNMFCDNILTSGTHTPLNLVYV